MTCGQLDCALQKAASDRGYYVKKKILHVFVSWLNKVNEHFKTKCVLSY